LGIPAHAGLLEPSLQNNFGTALNSAAADAIPFFFKVSVLLMWHNRYCL
jgi:hypothetical protein